MGRDISFSLLIKIFKKTWWKVTLIALAVMMLVAAYTHFLVPKKYSSAIQFYIVNIDANTDYASTQLLSAAGQLVNDYTDIISSEYMLTKVQKSLEELGYENVSVAALQGMLQHSSKTDSSVFTLSVVHTSPVVAYDVARVIAEIAPDVVTEIAKPENSKTKDGHARNLYNYIQYYNTYVAGDGAKFDLSEKDIRGHLDAGNATNLITKRECIRVLTPPKQAATHFSPNLVTATLLGGIAAFVAAYLLFLLRALFEQGITNEDDLKKLVGRPVIGVIPHWDGIPKK